jgi:glycosyltransferase involved in cell wall biosynthesis
MAGLGVRYHRLAEELAKRFEVTLAAPGDGPPGDVPYTFRAAEPSMLRELEADVVVAQGLPYRAVRSLRSRGTRVVVDLYVPSFVEAAAQLAADEAHRDVWSARYDETRRAQLVALSFGDAFICASERLRDFWLGALGAHGRVTPDRYRDDPTLRGLIDVIPFGLDPAASGAGGAIKGKLDGIAAGDRVLLWGGGIWNWYDPLTVIRAVGTVAERHPDVRLVFMGTQHPSAAVDEMAMTGRAIALADELGLAGKHVFFNDGWVPFDRRVSWYGDADIAVSAHLDTAEARLAFRTRLLEHIATGTPLVVTRGDVIGELVEQRGMGSVVAPGDADAFAAALLELLDDPAALASARAAVETERHELAWPAIGERLAALIESSLQVPTRGSAVAAAGAAAAAVRSSIARRGLAGTISAITRRS